MTAKAFTLIEILVMISIIALLAAIIFPAFQSARNKSQGSICLSNLRNMGHATMLYASDYDDHLPFGADNLSKHVVVTLGREKHGSPLDDYIKVCPTITNLLKPYGVSKEIVKCPSDKIDRILSDEGGHKPTWYEEVGSSYSYQETLAFTMKTLSGFQNPASTWIFHDYGVYHDSIQSQPDSGFYNILFIDGHIKNITWDDYIKLENGYSLEGVVGNFGFVR